MMGEFVQDDVETILRIATADEDMFPSEANFALLQMLPADWHTFFDQLGPAQRMDHADLRPFAVNEDRSHAIEVIAIGVQDEQGCLSRDRRDYFFGDLKIT